MRGKLVPQDPNDEPASVLLERIAAEKEQLIKDKKIKKQTSLPVISNEEKPFDLPKGWTWVRLGSVGICSTGKTPNTKESKNFDGDIPFLGPGQITPEGGLLPPEKFLSEEGVVNSTEAKSGDILMVCIGGSIGKNAISDRRITFNQQINAISPIHIISSFLHFAVSSNRFYKSILEKSTGSATPIINRSKWEKLLIPVCPDREQHRIVAKVDELMALCDQLEQQTEASLDAHQLLVDTLLATLTNAKDAAEISENWARLMATDNLPASSDNNVNTTASPSVFDTLFTTDYAVEQLKQTILQLAVMGKLVPQDPNDEPASELLKRIAADKEQLIKDKKIKNQKPLPAISDEEKPFELPNNWAYERIGTFAQVGTGATPSRANPHYWSPAEINWVSSGETSNAFIAKTKEKISPLAVTETNVTIYPTGTLIIAMYGQGKTRGQISELTRDAGTNQACAAIRPYEKDSSHREFIKIFFQKFF